MSYVARSIEHRRITELETLLAHKEQQIVILHEDLRASKDTTRRVNSRLVSTLDVLDALKSSYTEELCTIKRQMVLLQHKLARSTRDAKLAELERDDMQAAVLQLIEKVELSNGLEGFEPARLELPTNLDILVHERENDRLSYEQEMKTAEKRIQELERQVRRREQELERMIVGGEEDPEALPNRKPGEGSQWLARTLDWKAGMEVDDTSDEVHWYLDEVGIGGTSAKGPLPHSRNRDKPPPRVSHSYSSPSRGSPVPRSTVTPPKVPSPALTTRKQHNLPPGGVFPGVTSRLLQQLRGDINHLSNHVDGLRQQREAFGRPVSSAGSKRTSPRQQDPGSTRAADREEATRQRPAINGYESRGGPVLEKELYAELTSLRRSNESLQAALDLARQGAEARELALLRKVEELRGQLEDSRRRNLGLEEQNGRLRDDNRALKSEIGKLEEDRRQALEALEARKSPRPAVHPIPQILVTGQDHVETGISPIPSRAPSRSSNQYDPEAGSAHSNVKNGHPSVYVSRAVQAEAVIDEARSSEFQHHTPPHHVPQSAIPASFGQLTPLSALPQSTPPLPRRARSVSCSGVFSRAPASSASELRSSAPAREKDPLEGRFPFEEPVDPQPLHNDPELPRESRPHSRTSVGAPPSPQDHLDDSDHLPLVSPDDVLRLFETIEEGEASMELATPLTPSVLLVLTDSDRFSFMNEGIHDATESDDGTRGDDEEEQFQAPEESHTGVSEEGKTRDISALLEGPEIDLSMWSEAQMDRFEPDRDRNHHHGRAGVLNYDDSYVDVDEVGLGAFFLDDGQDTTTEEDEGYGAFSTQDDIGDGVESSFGGSSLGMDLDGEDEDEIEGDEHGHDEEDGADDTEPTVMPVSHSPNHTENTGTGPSPRESTAGR
ncbi:hypothetical protein AX16_005818 [Volvariella volvacea WC 439]|nr:hypothetical protein AX16_005818 [Volvariella volvacea WC 439]